VGRRFTATNIPLRLLIRVGWPQRTFGGPAWIDTEGYDVSAVLPEGDAAGGDYQLMMQNLLRERFALVVHVETRDAQVYALQVAKSGLALPDAIPEACLAGKSAPSTPLGAGCGAMNVTPESITDDKVSMNWFASVLAGLLGRPVINKTGFNGSFKAHMEFAPVAPEADSTRPSLADALKGIGLRLEPQKGTEDVLVIDEVKRPSAN
jgi:uncharacterized protein (TIGR03435 family)